jgi:alpha-amylase/alpha-mannosidase (GH57 family)
VSETATGAQAKLRVVLCWHMHQPEYRDLVTGEALLPWTYLHGIKDYVDMAYHLEAHPAAHAVVNFSPILLQQLEWYAAAVARHLRDGAPLPDKVLATLTPAGIPDAPGAARELLRACLRANRERLIERFAPYRELAATAEAAIAGAPFDTSLLVDLAVWFHLAWLGESLRREDPRVAALMGRERGYSEDERRTLLSLIGELLSGIIPRYRQLRAAGRVELSVTPWGHPIMPLLIDFAAARERRPGDALPEQRRYPGGESRARWHLARAMQAFTRAFGAPPRGCWPSEGAVSEATVALLDSFGFSWFASGRGVLAASLTRRGLSADGPRLNRAWRIKDWTPACFFRDDGLSDRIGFRYSTWRGDDAAADLVAELETIAGDCGGDRDRLVAIILDGENAWEYYPSNAYFFLSALYGKLSDHPTLRLTTFSAALDEGMTRHSLPELNAGSWVHGDLATWIGSPPKNRAWDLLCAAKHDFDRCVVEGALGLEQQARAEQQLAVCEGSDWAWWFTEDNPGDAVASFDALYRRQLGNLYRILGERVPESLNATIVRGRGAPEQGGTMRRADG